jgi:predicted P-loop ATPase
MASHMITSVFLNELDNLPGRVETTWDELAVNLGSVRAADCTLAACQRSECPHKRSLAWSPACWPDGATREKATVDAVSCLVLDLDHITSSKLATYLAALEPYAYILHSSHSDQPDDRCVRLVIQTSRPILGSEFATFWQAAVTRLDIAADKATKDASRLYYLPSRPKDAVHECADGTGFDCAVNDGLALDVDDLLGRMPLVRAIAPVPGVTVVPGFAHAPGVEQMSAAAHALGIAWPSTGRHQAQLALAGALTRAGWPADLVADFCTEVAEVQSPGNGNRPKRLAAALSSATKLAAGEAVSGWPTVAQHVGEEAVNGALRALGLAIAPDPAFAEAMTRAVSRSHAPTRLEVRAALERSRDALRRAQSLDKKLTSKLLAKVLKGEPLADHADEDRAMLLVQAAIAIVRAAPLNTTPELLGEMLLSPAGILACDVPRVVRLAIEHVKAQGPNPEDVTEDELAEPADDDELRDQLEIDKEGRTRSSGHNIERILRYSSELRGNLRFNQLTKQIEVPDGRFHGETPSGLPIGVKNWLGSHWKLSASTTEVAEQLLRVAQTWGGYNPVAEYLLTLKWDGVERVGSTGATGWLTTYCGVEDTHYARRVAAYFLISACARALDPGCKVDTVLILEGEQGLRKSTTLAILGGPWFTDTSMILGDKDSRLLAASSWIVELAELKSLLRDIEGSKAFLTQRYDDFRPPYGRAPERFQRRCVFAASTNEYEYLSDPTGNRRYHAVRTGRCDVESLQRDRDQLWAEAVHRYQAGERWWFHEDEQVLADEVIAQRRAEDPWVQMILTWTTAQGRQLGNQPPKTQFTIAEIAEHALKLTAADMHRNNHKISRALREAGFEPTLRINDSGQRRRVWARKVSATAVSAQINGHLSASNPAPHN